MSLLNAKRVPSLNSDSAPLEASDGPASLAEAREGSTLDEEAFPLSGSTLGGFEELDSCNMVLDDSSMNPGESHKSSGPL